MEFLEHTLSNGLEIVAESNPRAYSMALAFFVKTGARDETDPEHGVSHFLEHMVFKGTPRRSAADVNRELDEIGSHANAYTSEEHTVYHAAFLPEYQRQACDLLSDMMRPTLKLEDFETEKQVILEEIAKYDDQPPFGAHEKSMNLHFGDHPLHRSILGTIDSVTALTPESMRDYFQRRYSPKNITVVASGNVDFPQLIADLEQACGEWQTFDVERTAPRATATSAFEVMTKSSAVQEYIIQLANGPSSTDPDRKAAQVLATIFGDDSGSRLYWRLIDTGLAEYAVMATYPYQGTGLLMTYLCCPPDLCEQNLSVLFELQQQLQNDGISEEELARAKSKIASQLVLASERPQSRLFSVGNNWVQRREYHSVKETAESYEKISVAEIGQVIEKYPLVPNTTVAVGPLESLTPPWL